MTLCYKFIALIYFMYPLEVLSKSKVIIDADIGTDFDDTLAIAYALARHDTFDIKLLLMSSFNTTGRAQLTAKYLHYVNRTEIDIGIGIPTPNYRNLDNGVGAQMEWADDYDLSQYPGEIYFDGISRAKQILENGTTNDPIYVIAIGPHTNLAQIFTDNANLKQNMRLISMAGSIYKGYGTNYSEPEYNIYENGTASQIVWNHTNNIRFAYDACVTPLDTSYYFQIYGNTYQRLLNSNELVAKITLQNYAIWYKNGGDTYRAFRAFNPLNATSAMYDVQAVYMAAILSDYSAIYDTQIECNNSFMPHMKMETFKFFVDNNYYTVIDAPNSTLQNIHIAIEWNEGDFNGTYKMGNEVVNCLISGAGSDDEKSSNYYWIIYVSISVVILIVILVYYCWRRNKNDDSKSKHQPLTEFA